MTIQLIENLIPADRTNFRRGRRGTVPKALVIHATAAATAASTLGWFHDPRCQVSAHYLIDRDGTRIWRFVRDEDTAYHAGAMGTPALQARFPWATPGRNLNDLTIGLEHVGLPAEAWSPAMMATSADHIVRLCQRWGIPINRRYIVAHRELTATACPGKGNVDELVEMAQAIERKQAA